MKKIAVFQVDLNIGGIQKSCVNFLNNLDPNKYEVDLYLLEKKGSFIKDLKKHIHIIYLKKLPYITKLIPFSLIKLFYKPAIRKDYDIAVDFNSYANETACGVILTNAPKKYIWVHNDVEIKIKEEFLYRVLHFLFKSKYKYFDAFVGVSSGALESFVKVNKIKDKETIVIPNLIDTNIIKEKIEEESIIEVSDKTINICSTGRLVHQKGFDLLINFIYENKEKLENYHFYIIGDGNQGNSLDVMLNTYGIENMVTITGYLSNPYALMNKMDGFILLSRYEGQGIVFMEALSLDLDVIMPKHLEKYVSGYIKGSDDIMASLLNIKKRKHHFNALKDYNEDIINKINNL